MNNSINRFTGMLLGLIIILMVSCQSGTPLTDEQKSIVNLVFNDIFANQNYELNCKVDPLLGDAGDYNGDFGPIINEGLGALNNGSQILNNMNAADALRLSDVNGINTPDLLNISLKIKSDTIPKLGFRENVFVRMSTLGFSDDNSECVIIADRIYGQTNKIRFIYYLRKDASGHFTVVDKKPVYHFDPVKNSNLGFTKEETQEKSK